MDNLAEIAENVDRITDPAAIPNRVAVLATLNEEVYAHGNLAANIEFGDLILREGALRNLIPMLRSADPVAQRIGSMVLCNLSSNVRNQVFMLVNGLFDPLLTETCAPFDSKN